MRTPILVLVAIAVVALGAVWWSASREPAPEPSADAAGAAAEGEAPAGKRRKGLAAEAQRNPRMATKQVKTNEVAPAAADAREGEVPAELE